MSRSKRNKARHAREEALREELLQGQGRRCPYCNIVMGKKGGRRATFDHKTPRCRGGGDGRDNMHLTCSRCNNRKGRWTHEEFCLILSGL